MALITTLNLMGERDKTFEGQITWANPTADPDVYVVSVKPDNPRDVTTLYHNVPKSNVPPHLR